MWKFNWDAVFMASRVTKTLISDVHLVNNLAKKKNIWETNTIYIQEGWGYIYYKKF